MAKSTRLETDTRVETVRQLILSGVGALAIVRTVTDKWAVKDRQAWNYVIKAREAIAELTEQARPYLLAEHIAVRRDIRRRAREAHDLRAELAAAQDECKLFGLYAPELLTISDLRDKPDSDLISEFQTIVDAARTRAGDGDSG